MEKLLVGYGIDWLLNHTDFLTCEVYTCFYGAAEVEVVMRTQRQIAELVRALANDFGIGTKEKEKARELHNNRIVTVVGMAKALECHSIPYEMMIALATARVHHNTPCVMVIALALGKARVHHSSQNVTAMVVAM